MKNFAHFRGHVPNILTLSRIALTPFIFLALVKAPPAFRLAFLLFLVASLSDLLDGFLARKWDQQSALGAWLDPFADKILLTVTFVTLSFIGLIPLSLTAIVLARDICIVLGVFFLSWLGKSLTIQPLMISKVNTLLQMGLVSGGLLAGAGGWDLVTLRQDKIFQVVVALTAGTTIASGLAYAYMGWKIWRN